MEIPKNRPQMKREVLEERIKSFNIDMNKWCPLFVGVRGYYLDTLGEEGENDRGIYDDAMFIITPDYFFSYNANTDPSKYQYGIATLKKGFWPSYKFDLHRGQYLALCQRAGEVVVIRDNQGEDRGWFGINIHRGGINTTSSLGCQTIPPSQWVDFIDTAVGLAEQYKGKTWKKFSYAYLLLEEEDYR